MNGRGAPTYRLMHQSIEPVSGGLRLGQAVMDYQRVTRRVELDLIAALADAALAEVERHCGRLFAPAAGGEPRRVITELDVGAPLWLSVAPGATAPTMTVQAVEQWDDDASAWEAASADAYEVGPGGRTWRLGRGRRLADNHGLRAWRDAARSVDRRATPVRFRVRHAHTWRRKTVCRRWPARCSRRARPRWFGGTAR